MTIPTETTLDSTTLHRLITRDGIFHESGEQVTVMRKTIGEWRTVIENEFVVTTGTGIARCHACCKGLVTFPASKDALFKAREVRLRVDLRICHAVRLGRGLPTPTEPQ